MPRSLFISDLHLSENTPDIEHGFYKYLKKEGEISRLFLLGDLFEAWVGDDDDSALASRFCGAMRALAQTGTKIFVTRGNRDFLMGEAYLAAFGGTLLGDEVCVEVAGEPTLLMHGDTLCSDDTEYLAFRGMVHDAVWQREVMMRSLSERRLLATQLRTMSRDAASNKAADIMDVNTETVRDAMTRHSVKRLIHGHTHRPSRHQLPFGERIVLGDWNDTGWCLREVDENLELEEFTL